jgi:hypothetical protein
MKEKEQNIRGNKLKVTFYNLTSNRIYSSTNKICIYVNNLFIFNSYDIKKFNLIIFQFILLLTLLKNEDLKEKYEHKIFKQIQNLLKGRV